MDITPAPSEQITPSPPDISPPPKKTPIFILGGLIILFIGLVGGYYLVKSNYKPAQKACTLEAKICPDGSSVTRTGPNCEFAPCMQIKISPTPTSVSTAIALKYQHQVSWQTYTGRTHGFSIQYPPGYKLSEKSQTNNIYFLNCLVKDNAGKEICMSGFSIDIYDDYNQGSRRVWLNNKFSIAKPYYQDMIIYGSKALLVIEGNPGGSSGLLVVIPKLNNMIVFSQTFVAWDPDTGKLPDLSFVNQILSTFKFL